MLKRPFADPKAVRDLLVYSKNETSVSLRWLPPYPPYGVLRSYLVTYSYKYIFRTFTSEKELPVNHCDLWSGYHCADLQSLEEGYEYTITVRCYFLV